MGRQCKRYRADSTDSSSDEKDLKVFGEDPVDLVKRVDRKTIFFYSPVTVSTVLKFNVLLKRMSDVLTKDAWESGKQTSDEVITVFINSDGGDLKAGLSAADHIRHCRVKIRCVVDGDASSAATLMAVAATDTCLIMAHATILVHQLRSGVIGTQSEIKQETLNCNKFETLMRRLYLECCGRLTSPILTKTLKSEICLLPEEAVKQGFCDAVFTHDI